MLKNAPNQADNFVNFFVMLLNENQLLGSSAGSDLQAIKLLLKSIYCCILKGQSDTYSLLVFHDMTKFDNDRRT